MSRLPASRLFPKNLVCNCGTELASRALVFWSACSGVTLHFVQLRNPMQFSGLCHNDGTCHANCLI